MTRQRWLRINEIFEKACDLDSRTLSNFLNDACNGDKDLRAEVESLIATDRRLDDGFMKPSVRRLDDPSLSGKTILNYVVIEKVGEGGMGMVYKARAKHLGRIVALKWLPTELLTDPQRKRRFTQEALAVAALNHPNIITLYDFLPEHDVIVMEFVEGETLAEVIPNGGLELSRALDYAIQIASALEKAHSEGIIHRDLKPHNIMITHDGLVKVLDFGLAKITEPASRISREDNSLEVERPRTGVGVFMGTPFYASPEQVRGEHVDARSDIFSFGAVLYEMITGIRAFRGEDQLSAFASLARDQPTGITDYAPHAPIELQALISRALNKNPELRPASMGEVKEELVEIRDRVLRVGKSTPAESGAVLATGGPTASMPIEPTRKKLRFFLYAGIPTTGFVIAVLLYRAVHPAPDGPAGVRPEPSTSFSQPSPENTAKRAMTNKKKTPRPRRMENK